MANNKTNNNLTVKASTGVLDGKETLQEQLLSILSTMEEITLGKKDNEKFLALTELIKKSTFEVRDNGIFVDATIELREKISKALTIEGSSEPLITPADTENPEKLTKAITDYVEITDKALSTMNAGFNVERESYEKTIAEVRKELDEAKKNAQPKVSSSINNTTKNKKGILSSTPAKIAAGLAGVLFIGQLVGMGITHNIWGKDRDALANANNELGEVAGILGENYKEGDDISEALKNYIDGLQSTAGENAALKAENEALKEENAVLKAEINEVADILEGTDKEISIEGTDISAGVVTIIEKLSKGEVIVSPDDGITQENVDEVYNVVLEVLGEMGISAEDLQEGGKFSSASLKSALTDMVSEIAENNQIASTYVAKVSDMLGKIVKEETEVNGETNIVYYTLTDFATKEVEGEVVNLSKVDALSEACDFIYKHYSEKYNKLVEVFNETDGTAVTIEDFDSMAEALDWIYDQLADIDINHEKLVEENNELKTQIEGLKTQVGELEAENKELEGKVDDLEDALNQSANAGQGGSGKDETSTDNAPVGDKEVDESTTPGQEEADTTKQPVGGFEPGV